jgi:hypothetical protein
MTEETNEHKRLHDFVPPETREHLKAARNEMRKGYEALFPPGFVAHHRAARRELLLAARGLIDAAIKHVDEKSE